MMMKLSSPNPRTVADEFVIASVAIRDACNLRLRKSPAIQRGGAHIARLERDALEAEMRADVREIFPNLVEQDGVAEAEAAVLVGEAVVLGLGLPVGSAPIVEEFVEAQSRGGTAAAGQDVLVVGVVEAQQVVDRIAHHGEDEEVLIWHMTLHPGEFARDRGERV